MNASFKKVLLSTISENDDVDGSYVHTSKRITNGDPLPRTIFPQNTISFFNRIQLGNISICTYSSAASKIADDSTVVFRVQDKLHMGRIRSIFTVVETNATFLLVDYSPDVKYFTCFAGNNEEVIYSSIQSCFKKDLSVRLIQTSHVIEKCVYFEHSNGECHFMRFPNLEHSS